MANGAVLSIVAALSGGVAIVAGMLGRSLLARSRAPKLAFTDTERAGTISLAQLQRVARLRGAGTYRVTVARSARIAKQDQIVSGTAEAALIALVAGLRRTKTDKICVVENQAELLRIERSGGDGGAAEIAIVPPSTTSAG